MEDRKSGKEREVKEGKGRHKIRKGEKGKEDR